MKIAGLAAITSGSAMSLEQAPTLGASSSACCAACNECLPRVSRVVSWFRRLAQAEAHLLPLLACALCNAKGPSAFHTNTHSFRGQTTSSRTRASRTTLAAGAPTHGNARGLQGVMTGHMWFSRVAPLAAVAAMATASAVFAAPAVSAVDELGPPPASFLGFATLTQQADYMRRAAQLFPGVVTGPHAVGVSVAGADILAVCLGVPCVGSNSTTASSPDVAEPAVLFTALHHAREPLGMAVILHFVHQLLVGWQAGEHEAVALLLARRVWLLPCVNPDGYASNTLLPPRPVAQRMVRKNRAPGCANGHSVDVGVDLNRNYDFSWQLDNVGSSPDPCAEDYRGPSPFSEPESRAVRDLVAAQRPQVAINWHSFGRYVNLPYAVQSIGTPAEPTYSVLRGIAAELCHAAGTPVDGKRAYQFGHPWSGGLYSVNGDASDWMLAAHGVLAFSPELGPDMNADFNSGMWPSTATLPALVLEGTRMSAYAAWAAGPLLLAEAVQVRFDACQLGDAAAAARPGGLLCVNVRLHVVNRGGASTRGPVLLTLLPAAALLRWAASPACAEGEGLTVAPAACALVRASVGGLNPCASELVAAWTPAEKVSCSAAAAGGGTDRGALLVAHGGAPRFLGAGTGSRAGAARAAASSLRRAAATVPNDASVGATAQRGAGGCIASAMLVPGALGPQEASIDVTVVAAVDDEESNDNGALPLLFPAVCSARVAAGPPVSGAQCAARMETAAAAHCATGLSHALTPLPVSYLAISDDTSCVVYSVSCDSSLQLMARAHAQCGLCAPFRNSAAWSRAGTPGDDNGPAAPTPSPGPASPLPSVSPSHAPPSESGPPAPAPPGASGPGSDAGIFTGSVLWPYDVRGRLDPAIQLAMLIAGAVAGATLMVAGSRAAARLGGRAAERSPQSMHSPTIPTPTVTVTGTGADAGDR
jgi:hypothetical protein